ncbi:MAG: flagellar hook protein FlgE [Acidimicrobiales bacterium]
MMRSMFAAVSGLRSHQVMADVIGNNIANVNTTGFKSSRVEFADTMSQLMQAGSLATSAAANVNPTQIGLGVKVAATQLSQTPGAAQVTNQTTDVAIQGDGFFVVRMENEQLYSRAGSFRFDALGRLANPSGGLVQGWLIDPATNEINSNAPLTDIEVPTSSTIEPQITTEVVYGGNMSAVAAVGDPPAESVIEVVDGQGVPHKVSLSFEKTAIDQWTLTMTDVAGGGVINTTTLDFDPANGQLVAPPAPFPVTFTTPNGENIVFDLDLTQTTQYGTPTDPRLISSDGSEAGSLRGFAIDANGIISGVFSNGETRDLAQLALAAFSNPNGLGAEGDTVFRSTLASGDATVGAAGTSGRGLLAAGQVEASNVELALEFTNLIIAQRGFQANSRVITTSDEMIQELVNLTR